MAGKINGRAGFITFNGSNLPIQKWDITSPRQLTDVTDSSNYDAASDMVWPAQLPGSVHLEGTIEAVFNTATTGTAVSALMFNSGGPYAVILGFDATHNYGHGNFDLSNFHVSTQVGPQPETVKFTVNFKSNGVFTANS